MNDPLDTSLAIVLCGGRSTRMGTPKEWMTFHGETMLGRVVRILLAECGHVIVAAASGQALPPLPHGVTRVDDPQEGLGPLQGLATALEAAALRGFERAFVAGADLPLLEPGWATRFLDLLTGDNEAVVPVEGGKRIPIPAAYRTSLAGRARELLSNRRASLQALLDVSRVQLVEPEAYRDIDPDRLSLRNINTPAEYASAVSVAKPPKSPRGELPRS